MRNSVIASSDHVDREDVEEIVSVYLVANVALVALVANVALVTPIKKDQFSWNLEETWVLVKINSTLFRLSKRILM